MYDSIACETGWFNTAVLLYVVAIKSSYLLDVDLAGRAIPEVQNSTFYIHGLPASPITLANPYGEVTIYANVKDDKWVKVLLRDLSKVRKNHVSVSCLGNERTALCNYSKDDFKSLVFRSYLSYN